MMTTVEKPEGNYSFASYSSKDKAIVSRIHDFLETFKLPGDAPLLKVYFDQTDLVARGLWDELATAIQDSNYLVLFVSLSSMNSSNVQRELAIFLKTKSLDKVLLVLLDGNESLIPISLRGQKHIDLRRRMRFLPFFGKSRNELVRLVSAISNQPLRQLIPWDRIRLINKVITIAIPVAFVVSAFGGVAFQEWRSRLDQERTRISELAQALGMEPSMQREALAWAWELRKKILIQFLTM
jgi:TIR domain